MVSKYYAELEEKFRRYDDDFGRLSRLGMADEAKKAWVRATAVENDLAVLDEVSRMIAEAVEPLKAEIAELKAEVHRLKLKGWMQ